MKSINYAQLREKIKKSNSIWVFGTSGDSFFSKLIRRGTQMNTSHVGFLIFLGGRLWVVEMMIGKGCVSIPASNRLLSEKVVTIAEFTKIKNDKTIESILSSVGKIEYDTLGAFLSVFIDTKTGKRFCSEFVSKELGLNFPSLNRGIFPGDIINKADNIYNLSL